MKLLEYLKCVIYQTPQSRKRLVNEGKAAMLAKPKRAFLSPD
jgi:hypothetical protein